MRQAKTERLYIESPTELNTAITASADGVSIKISPLSVANAVVMGEGKLYSSEFSELMKALYLYYYRACEYSLKGGA